MPFPTAPELLTVVKDHYDYMCIICYCEAGVYLT